MRRRNSYSDLGLVVAVSVFICVLVKCLLFGFTWVSIVWLVFSCVYFYVSWHYPSNSAVVKHSTTLFLVLSVVAVVSAILFDKNARPVMHAFEGTGDTIQDAVAVEEEPIAPIYEAEPGDTVLQDSAMEEDFMSDSIIDHQTNVTDAVIVDTTIVLQ